MLEELCKKWEATYRYGTVEERKKRGALWEPYYTGIYESQLGKSFALPKEEAGIIRELVKKGILNKDSKVLDIGCGTGYYTLQMAKHCKSVTAIDCNEAAIAVLRERLENCEIQNVEEKSVAWEDFETLESFDLVFTSLCPAICNLEELKRMEGLTKDYCVIHTVQKGSYDKYRKMMMEELKLKPEGMVTEYSIYLDVLKALGRSVETYEESSHREYQSSLPELLENYKVYFKIFGMEEAQIQSFVTDFFEKHQVDGHLQDESQMNMGLLIWKPKTK
ncbi:MAG: class I SAM-dependent methyltransferase [Lachnospiraceae bacterium]|nr:class I SAM-dependent methyltransferase [Lachnospiraceae bacterium]